MEDDVDLVRRALARDQQAFAALYDRYADKLFDYARRQTGNASDAGDIVQDTFVLAIQRLHQLRDPSLVRPWLYAIARSEVHRRHRRVNKLQFTEPDEQAAMSSGAPTADDLVHQQELRVLFAQAANGLDPSDREVLDLHLRHSMTGAEIAAALGIPERQVGVVVQRVRERLGRSIGVVLLATTPKCAELIELQRTEGSPLTVLSRKRLARHIEGCLTCSQQLSDRMRPETLLAALPIALAPAFLRQGVLQRMADAVHLVAPTSSSASTSSGEPSSSSSSGSSGNGPQPDSAQSASGSSADGANSRGGRTEPSANTSRLAGGRQAPVMPAARALPQREGGRVWQTSDGFPRQAPPVRRTAFIAIAASAVLVLFGVLVATGGDSAKRLTAGNTTLEASAVLDDSTTLTTPNAQATTGASTTADVTTTSTPTGPSTTALIVLPTTPVVTAPPVVNPTNPPATNPPGTNPPATNPPATNPPATTPPPTTIAPDTSPPVFQSASASPFDISADFTPGFGATCPDYPVTAMISATVTDDRVVASVSLRYTAGVNSYNASLSKVGNAWQVTIGPLSTAQFAVGDYPINAQFTATDTSGNSRVSNVNSIAVLHDCLIIT